MPYFGIANADLLDILLLIEVAEMDGYKGRIVTLERWADAVEYFRNNGYSLCFFIINSNVFIVIIYIVY